MEKTEKSDRVNSALIQYRNEVVIHPTGGLSFTLLASLFTLPGGCLPLY